MKAAQFPKYRSHEAAQKWGCFQCCGPLDGEPADKGYPEGRYAQLCTRCGMSTFYDVEVEVVRCCADPQVRGGRCENCGEWMESGADMPQGDNEG